MNKIIKNFLIKNLKISKLTRFNIIRKKDATKLLIKAAKLHYKNSRETILIISNKDNLSKQTIGKLKKFPIKVISVDQLPGIYEKEVSRYSCIISCHLDTRTNHGIGILLINTIQLSQIPFEFISIPHYEYDLLKKYDDLKTSSFVSPLLISKINYFDIYEESLLKFNKKCQIRDYMDICQILDWMLNQDLDGDLVEFGSLEGHSGFLISRILEEHNSMKRLYMFDMFEEFPEEGIGVDFFWNKISHQVEYNEVKLKFKDNPKVTLVKGDFTETFPKTNIDKICFVYVDCDSFRGTEYILENIFEDKLVTNGVVVLEDYGHGPILGNRIAFHNYFDKRRDCFKFFSQFSGFQIAIKL